MTVAAASERGPAAVQAAGASNKTTPSGQFLTSSHGWQAQLIAARFALPLEIAATVAALALGGRHG